MKTNILFVGTLLYYQSHQLFTMLAAIYLTSCATLLYNFLTVFIGPGRQFLFIVFSIIKSFIIFGLIKLSAKVNAKPWKII